MSRLIPQDLKAQMIRNFYDVTERGILDHPPVIKLFAGNAIWLLSKINPVYQDIAYGLCDLGFRLPKLDIVSIKALEKVKHPYPHFPHPFVERDEHFTALYPMSVYVQAACIRQRITENPETLSIIAKTITTKKEL